MRLMIREYLSMLKESDELDVIVPDLLNAMGIDVLAGAQKGVRQDGVDIHGVGIDPETGIKTNYLITVKKGNITRNIWSSDKQSVRQSLEEITDVYMTQKMSNEHKKLPSKIILCYGGEMRQEVQPNWTGFTNKYSDYTFEDWGGNRLSGLIETYLTDEHLFFEDVKKETKTALLKVFQKVEEIGKISVLKIQMSNIRGQIRDNKTDIGEFVTSNIKEFSKFPEIIKIIDEISVHEKEILLKKEKIEMLQGKAKSEAKA